MKTVFTPSSKYILHLNHKFVIIFLKPTSKRDLFVQNNHIKEKMTSPFQMRSIFSLFQFYYLFFSLSFLFFFPLYFSFFVFCFFFQLFCFSAFLFFSFIFSPLFYSRFYFFSRETGKLFQFFLSIYLICLFFFLLKALP